MFLKKLPIVAQKFNAVQFNTRDSCLCRRRTGPIAIPTLAISFLIFIPRDLYYLPQITCDSNNLIYAPIHKRVSFNPCSHFFLPTLFSESHTGLQTLSFFSLFLLPIEFENNLIVKTETDRPSRVKCNACSDVTSGGSRSTSLDDVLSCCDDATCNMQCVLIRKKAVSCSTLLHRPRLSNVLLRTSARLKYDLLVMFGLSTVKRLHTFILRKTIQMLVD